MIKNLFKNIGPGPLVAAAFIGPGTVTLCTLAGVNFGYALLWAMLLSIFATVVLQEMAARIGLVSGKGLSEVIRLEIQTPLFRSFTVLLILFAIVIGNAAYEAGNISGAVLGMEAIGGKSVFSVGAMNLNIYSIIIGFIAFVLIYIGNYKILEKALISLVILMSLAFLIAAIITKPDLGGIIKGMFIPSAPSESLFTVIGLIGTTVVPYNLFLHASLVKEKWEGVEDLAIARKDTYLSVILGGLVSMAIIVAAASIQDKNIESASDLAKGLEPLFGSFSKYVMSIGLFAAGLTSAVTAPLAAAFVAQGCFGWEEGMKTRKFRLTAGIILLLGVISASSGIKSIEIIKFAQVANGLLLPIIAAILIWIVNKRSLMGNFRNNIARNIAAMIILGISVFLGMKSVLKVFGWI